MITIVIITIIMTSDILVYEYIALVEKITRGRRNGTYLRCQYWQNSQYRTYNSTLVLGEQDICKYAM